jgi:hypothetical protein
VLLGSYQTFFNAIKVDYVAIELGLNHANGKWFHRRMSTLVNLILIDGSWKRNIRAKSKVNSNARLTSVQSVKLLGKSPLRTLTVCLTQMSSTHASGGTRWSQDSRAVSMLWRIIRTENKMCLIWKKSPRLGKSCGNNAAVCMGWSHREWKGQSLPIPLIVLRLPANP